MQPPHLDTQLPALLLEAADLLDCMGSDFSGFSRQLLDLRKRLDQGRVRIAVVGQFKRGKSSLLNALLGEALLPTGVVPLTSIPTVVKYGTERRLRLEFQDGRCEEESGRASYLAKRLMESVTEKHNPGNRLGIAVAELHHPCPLLAAGIEIVDTPGIGSTVLRNTDTARSVVPVCDAAIFVLSPDPPITEVELQFLRAVKQAVPRVLFVLTKADLVKTSDREEMLAFLERVLHEEADCASHEPICLVSAQVGFQMAAAGSEDDGMDRLKTRVNDFMASEARIVLTRAIRAKAARLLGEALFALELQWKAVALPRQELDRRAELFEAQLHKLAIERERFGALLQCDLTRLAYHLDQLGATEAAKVHDALVAHACRVPQDLDTSLNPRALDSARRVSLARRMEELLESTGRAFDVQAQMHVIAIEEAHIRVIEQLIDRIRRTAADMFEVPCLEGVRLARLDAICQPRLMSHRWTSSFLEEALLWGLRWLPVGWQRRYLEKKLIQDLSSLAVQNVREIRLAAQANLQEAVRSFQVRMEQQIGETVSVIRESLWTAMVRQKSRESSAWTAERVEESRQRLTGLASRLGEGDPLQSTGGPI